MSAAVPGEEWATPEQEELGRRIREWTASEESEDFLWRHRPLASGYTGGGCFLLAGTLGGILGEPLAVVFDEDEYGFPAHGVVRLGPDVFLDAFGLHSRSELQDEYGGVLLDASPAEMGEQDYSATGRHAAPVEETTRELKAILERVLGGG